MDINNYAVFILTNGRPDKVVTYNTLRKQGYSGKIYLIVDNEDSTRHEYIEKYGSEVIIFDKKKYANTFDIMDNFEGDKVVVYARNACGDIARKLKLDYFLEFEDDYNIFRLVDVNHKTRKATTQLDEIFKVFLECLERTKVKTLAFAQGGDFIGGFGSQSFRVRYKRKAMNTFFMRVGKKEEDIVFKGRFNDDVNTYLERGRIGEVFIQTAEMMMDQSRTQKVSGGNTESYIKYGTYVKSFYSVMMAPSCCKIAIMKSHGNERIHHEIKWDNAVPKILRESCQKSSRN